MNKLWIFLAFLLAPLLAIVIFTKGYAENHQVLEKTISEIKFEKPTIDSVGLTFTGLSVNLSELTNRMATIQEIVIDHEKIFSTVPETIENSIQSSKDQKFLSDDIYEQRIIKALGEPIDFYLSATSEIKVFELEELGYRGYIAKIKLYNPDVFKVALSNGVVGKLETTSDASKRTGAILGVNGGGFGAAMVDGEVVSTMIGATVVDGVFVKEFVKKDEELFFVGINKSGDLVGTVPENNEDIEKLNPYQGTSFIPILITDGNKVDLPSSWRKTKHPRTIIGQYANDDIILIVVDGRRNDWSKGISLERLQDKLIELGVKNAYNLDGGGSTAMYFKGEILNKPSDGRERPVANNIIILP